MPAAAMALRAVCSGIQIQGYTHTHTHIQGCIEPGQLLLNRETDIKGKDYDKQSPLHKASLPGNEARVGLLAT